MKNYILILFALLAFSGCEEFVNSAEESVITYLATVSVIGETNIEFECDEGVGYTDEGATAIISGTEVPYETAIHGVYMGMTDVTVPDIYEVTYSAINEDGIPGVATRSITWPECNSDLITGIEGMYTASVVRDIDGTKTDYSDAEHGPYWVSDLGGGDYGFSCSIGQFYEYGAAYGYGSQYAGTGLIMTANDIPTNDFTTKATDGVGAFGGTIVISDFKVNPVNKTISWTADWDGWFFDVVLTQVP